MSALRNQLLLYVGIPVACVAVFVVALQFREEEPDPFDACIDRGIQHFSDIGSWPRLSDGRSARAEIVERCSRTTGAF